MKYFVIIFFSCGKFEGSFYREFEFIALDYTEKYKIISFSPYVEKNRKEEKWERRRKRGETKKKKNKWLNRISYADLLMQF